MIRTLLIGLLVLAPVTVLADASTDSTAQSNSLQSSDAASVSPQSSSLLQPASSTNSPLQSANAGGASQSQDEDTLQQTNSSDQSKLLIEGGGEAPETLSDPPNVAWLGSILLVLVATTIMTGVVVLIDRRTVAPSQ